MGFNYRDLMHMTKTIRKSQCAMICVAQIFAGAVERPMEIWSHDLMCASAEDMARLGYRLELF